MWKELSLSTQSSVGLRRRLLCSRLLLLQNAQQRSYTPYRQVPDHLVCPSTTAATRTYTCSPHIWQNFLSLHQPWKTRKKVTASLETHGANTQPGSGDHSPAVHSSQLRGLRSACSALLVGTLRAAQSTQNQSCGMITVRDIAVTCHFIEIQKEIPHMHAGKA